MNLLSIKFIQPCSGKCDSMDNKFKDAYFDWFAKPKLSDI